MPPIDLFLARSGVCIYSLALATRLQEKSLAPVPPGSAIGSFAVARDAKALVTHCTRETANSPLSPCPPIHRHMGQVHWLLRG